MTEFENENLEQNTDSDTPQAESVENSSPENDFIRNDDSETAPPEFSQTTETEDIPFEEEEPEQKKKMDIPLSRHIIQGISFFLFPALFFTVLSSLGNILASILNGSFVLSQMWGQLVLVGGILLITTLWGRFFCGYVCALGAAGDLIYYLSEKIMPEKWKISAKTDKRMKYVKYFILILLVAGVCFVSLPVFSSVQPVFGGKGRHITPAVTKLGVLFFLVFVAGSFFIERFFCRYLCPLGAVFTPLSKVRLFRIRRNASQCIGCENCSKNCSMGITVHNKKTVSSGECIDCMNCIATCPEQCVKSKSAPIITGAVTALMIALLVITGQMFPAVGNKNNMHSFKDKNNAGYDRNMDKDRFGHGQDKNSDSSSSNDGKDKKNDRGKSNQKPDINSNKDASNQKPDSNTDKDTSKQESNAYSDKDTSSQESNANSDKDTSKKKPDSNSDNNNSGQSSDNRSENKNGRSFSKNHKS